MSDDVLTGLLVGYLAGRAHRHRCAAVMRRLVVLVAVLILAAELVWRLS